MPKKNNDLVISNFKGIGQSYNADFYNIRNLDIYSVPGSARIAKKTTAMSFPANVTFTANTTTEELTLSSARDWVTGTPVTFTTTNTLPAPLAISTTYYLIFVDSLTYKLATSWANAKAGTEIDITTTGTGTHTLVAPVMQMITKFVEGGSSSYSDGGTIYGVDLFNRVFVYNLALSNWQIVGGKGNASGSGQGLVYWKDYIFVMTDTNIDVWGPLSGTPAWSLSWFSIESGATHPAIVGQDDILYIGAGRYVASVTENAGQNFAPGTSASYTQNPRALDLAEDYVVSGIEELGINLMIGTTNINRKNALIFPWNRVDTSFSIPIEIQENGVQQMININNLLYVSAGADGRVYVTDGANTILFAQLPKSLIGLDRLPEYDLTYRPQAILNNQGRLHIGVSGIANGLVNLGVYSISTTGDIVLQNTISTGNAGGTENSLKIGALFQQSTGSYIMSWEDGVTAGIDKVHATDGYTSYASYVETGLFVVGREKYKKEYKEVEITFARDLATGDGIKLYFRENLTDSYTLFDTVDFATHGAVSYKVIYPLNLRFTTVQFKVEFTTASSTTPELMSIRFVGLT